MHELNIRKKLVFKGIKPKVNVIAYLEFELANHVLCEYIFYPG